MSELPPNWLRLDLLGVAELVRGVTYSKTDAHESPFDGSIPVLRANNIQDRGFDLGDLVHVPSALVSESQRIKTGDVVVATSSGSINVVGKAAQARKDIQAGFGAFCGLMRPVSGIDQRYFGYFFSTDEYRKKVSSMARGVNINNLKRDHFAQLSLPIAPISEQTRIADKLDAILARVDACRGRLDRVPAILKRFRQSVLAAATSGKLTEEWRIGLGRQTELRTIEFDDDAIDIPRTWGDHSLRDLIDPQRPLCYGVVQPGSASPSGILLIRVQDMERGAILVDQLRTVSADVDREYRRSRVKGGDLLVSVVGTIGRTALVPAGLKANIARAVARVACKPGVSSRWVDIWLSCGVVQWWLTKTSREVARKTLNLADLGSTRIALPPNDEQTEIVRRVDELFAYADRLEARYATARAQVERLTPALLAKAFRGELVPQDPNDEPASTLLERIRAERANQHGAARRGRKLKKQEAAL